MPLQSRFQEDSLVEIGVDEAGRGSFWGPLTAGAMSLPPESEWSAEQRSLLANVRDSKKISPKKRDNMADQLKEHFPLCAVGMVTADEINQHGITWANQEAFRRAIMGINTPNIMQCRILIDGTLPIDKWEGEQHLIVDGDATYVSIAAASILAKVEHDRWIQAYCTDHPECADRYDLRSCNGYGTAKHREGIKLYGGHTLHRELYIQNWLPGANRVKKEKQEKQGKQDNKTKKGEGCLIRFTA